MRRWSAAGIAGVVLACLTACSTSAPRAASPTVTLDRSTQIAGAVVRVTGRGWVADLSIPRAGPDRDEGAASAVSGGDLGWGVDARLEHHLGPAELRRAQEPVVIQEPVDFDVALVRALRVAQLVVNQHVAHIARGIA